MARDIKITGLANKDELLVQPHERFRLYKFALSGAPDGLWVLLLQQAGAQFPDVTLSGNAGQAELWASAAPEVSAHHVLACAKRGVAQANAEAAESDRFFDREARERAEAEAAAKAEAEAAARAGAEAEAAKAALASELDELSFDDELGSDESGGPGEPPAS